MSSVAVTMNKSFKKRVAGKKKYVLLIIALPFLVLLILFNFLPLFGWVTAFFKYKPGIPLLSSPFVGLKYFIMIFTDKVDMLRVMKNTVVFALLGYACAPLPMILALLINEIHCVPFKKFVQTTTTLPNFISWIIVFSISFMMFSSDGVLNKILLSIGLVKTPLNILSNASITYLFQTLLNVWKGVGWSSIIYLAAISGIDAELYDAAMMDGAGRFNKAIHITLPGLMPTFIVLLLLSIGSFVGVGFEQYFIFKNPATSLNIEVLDVYVYRVGLMNNDYSYGVAIGIIKSLISIALLFGTNLLSKKVRGASII